MIGWRRPAASRAANSGALSCLLQGGAWEVIFASRYLATRRPERLRASPLAVLPLLPGVFESSLWLVKRR